MKIKLFLLSLISCMSILGFTSAVELSIISDGPEYNPSSYTLENDITFTTNSFSNISCMDYGMISISSSNSNLSCDFEYNNGSFSLFQNNNNCTFTAGTTINFSKGAGETCESLTLNLGGSSSEGGNNGNIIAGGINTFSGTIGRLGEIAGEFIPYMIYIFIGYLGIVLMYNAVKYILLYLQYKSEDTFGARRKYGKYEELREEGGIRVQTPKEREREELAGNEQDEYENLYKQFQDEVINRHYETQEEKLKARIEWKKRHPGSENF